MNVNPQDLMDNNDSGYSTPKTPPYSHTSIPTINNERLTIGETYYVAFCGHDLDKRGVRSESCDPMPSSLAAHQAAWNHFYDAFYLSSHEHEGALIEEAWRTRVNRIVDVPNGLTYGVKLENDGCVSLTVWERNVQRYRVDVQAVVVREKTNGLDEWFVIRQGTCFNVDNTREDENRIYGPLEFWIRR